MAYPSKLGVDICAVTDEQLQAAARLRPGGGVDRVLPQLTQP